MGMHGSHRFVATLAHQSIETVGSTPQTPFQEISLSERQDYGSKVVKPCCP